MNKLLFIFLGLGMIMILSCSDKEQVEEIPTSFCVDDYAEYYYNNTLFKTMHLPDLGEILTVSGESCGIGAVLNESENILTLRILGEEQQLNMHTEITNLNEELEFRFVEYTDDNINSTFGNLILTNQNYILIEELNTLEHTMKGSFNLKIENSSGDTINITSGLFNCSYHVF